MPDSPLSALEPLEELIGDAADRAKLVDKVLVVPKLLFGKTFSRGEQPYQDFVMLVDVRNDIVHYSMEPGVTPSLVI